MPLYRVILHFRYHKKDKTSNSFQIFLCNASVKNRGLIRVWIYRRIFASNSFVFELSEKSVVNFVKVGLELVSYVLICKQ